MPTMRLKYKAWEDELQNDTYILFAFWYQNGFDIIDSGADPSQVRYNNHLSAQPSNPVYAKATEQINIEIQNGNYIEIQESPEIFSPWVSSQNPMGCKTHS